MGWRRGPSLTSRERRDSKDWAEGNAAYRRKLRKLHHNVLSVSPGHQVCGRCAHQALTNLYRCPRSSAFLYTTLRSTDARIGKSKRKHRLHSSVLELKASDPQPLTLVMLVHIFTVAMCLVCGL